MRNVWGKTLSFMGMIVGLSSCLSGGTATSTSSSLIKYCELASNQLGSLSGRWRSLPIPVAFREGQFTADEISQIIFAINTWNKFFMKVHGVQAFEAGTAENPNLSTQNRSAALCSKTIIDSSGNWSGQVVIFKNTRWPFTTARSAIAFTSFCTNKNQYQIHEMGNAVIDLNYEDFFASGKPQPDLVTNLLHELGHVSGLDHSCNSKSESDSEFVGCGSRPPQEYLDAVMYAYDVSSA
ncbi:MAG: hypothetical protein EOP09_13130, partial [Proteobacteria bacterium]